MSSAHSDKGHKEEKSSKDKPKRPLTRKELLAQFGFKDEEKCEILATKNVGSDFASTGFPKPKKSFRLSYEVYDLSLEEPYFWVLEELRQSFAIVEKLEDTFAAAENSAFFGVTQQRLGAQQDKISQFLATTGKMIKELFQMVRELRIIDERLEYYIEAEKELAKPLKSRGNSAEITLKGIFVDLVQGGGKSAASVYGMARELEFITLPDLFFDAPGFKDSGELEAHVNGLGKDFNKNVLRVLARHLQQFMQWKKSTHMEHASRKRFMLNYLEQHYQIINMYLEWVKPYLRHVERLSFKEASMRSPDIISAFEGSMLDIELLARKRVVAGKLHDEHGHEKEIGANACVLATFNYRTRPELKVVQEGYQRGPVHIGRYEMNYRVYTWSDEQVEKYKELKKEEALHLMGNVSASVQQAMEALGDDLKIYLAQARDQRESAKKEHHDGGKGHATKKGFMRKLFGDFYHDEGSHGEGHGGHGHGGHDAKHAKEVMDKLDSLLDGSLKKYAIQNCWPAYHNFKKAHKMITW
ncbi:hypothetical protein HYV86_04240 [Candidatus Woesearchaeota archaeon]|nr:hypothetical protein [Candidatus Woesearchaeota archaeon]